MAHGVQCMKYIIYSSRKQFKSVCLVATVAHSDLRVILLTGTYLLIYLLTYLLTKCIYIHIRIQLYQ